MGGILLFSTTVWAGSGGRGGTHTHTQEHTRECCTYPLATYPLKSARITQKISGGSNFQERLNGGVSNGGVSRSGLVLPFLSFFVLFGTFPICSGILPICSGMVRGFSRLVLFLFLGLLRAPTRNSPERVRDTIWTFPKKSGKHPGLETPRFSFSQNFDVVT